MQNCTRVFLYSSHPTPYIEPLLQRNIYVERVLDDVHPFATVGETEESMQKYLSSITDVSSIVSIKKNLYNMLTRNQEEYESDYGKIPVGKEVDYYNTTEYIILCFSNFRRPLYRIGDAIYSNVFPKNEFTKDIESREALPILFPKTFNWKYYMELLAETCLKNYGSNHIILIRTNIPEWNWNGQTLCMNEFSSKDMRTTIRSAEDYFVELTHCHCIEEFLGHYSRSLFGPMPSYVYEMVADEIQEIVRGNKVFFYKSFHCLSKLIHSLYMRMNSCKLEIMRDDLERYSMDVSTSIEKLFLNKQTGTLYSDLQKLKIFLRNDSQYSLTDYCRDNKMKAIDIKILELYTEYFKLDMDDLLAIYVMLSRLKEKKVFESVIKNICDNRDCYPFISIKNVVRKNCQYLEKYKYIDKCLRKSLSKLGKLYIARISENMYIHFSLNLPGFVKLTKWTNKMPCVDFIFKNDMRCRADEIEMLSKNWPFYIARAKCGRGNVPLKLVFNSDEEFLSSLVFLDYEKILESENAIITLNENVKKTNDIHKGTYKSKCNLEILLDPNTKIFHMAGGLADQIKYYLYAKRIEESSGARLVYEDFDCVRGSSGFMKMKLPQVINEDSTLFSDNLLSNIISRQLYETFISSKKSFSGFLMENGIYDLVSVLFHRNAIATQDTPGIILKGNRRIDIDKAAEKCFKYYFYVDHPEFYMRNEDWMRKYISFPKYDDDRNQKIADEMLSCDAVVLHVRCGDMITVNPGTAPNPDFIYKCIENLLKLTEYRNKKYFIFSDDMKWVKSNSKAIGLELLDVNDIRYVEHNKRDASFWDMKLMSLGKIIIATNSGFSHVAGLLGTRKEIFVFQTSWLNDALYHIGWKNRYDIHMRCCFIYKFISHHMIDTSKWETETIKSDIMLNDSNKNYYRYDITKGHRKYAIRLKGISAAFIEFTAGLHDFIDNQAVQYEVYSTTNECWFNFCLTDEIEGLAFCIYAGRRGNTSGNAMRVDEFSVKFSCIGE